MDDGPAKSPEPSDEALMEAYVGGDTQAFQRLFERHAPVLRAMMRRHTRHPQEASDLVQHTFLLLHRARADFKPGSKLRPWLYTIGMNALREHFRKKGRRREDPLEEEQLRELPSAPESGGLEERQEAALREQRVRGALAELPESQRVVIELHWFQGMGFPEVARVVGASVNAVKVRAHRGYVALRARLGGGETGGAGRHKPEEER